MSKKIDILEEIKRHNAMSGNNKSNLLDFQGNSTGKEILTCKRSTRAAKKRTKNK